MSRREVETHLGGDQAVLCAICATEICRLLKHRAAMQGASSPELRRSFVRTHRLKLDFLTTRRAITRLRCIWALVFSFRLSATFGERGVKCYRHEAPAAPIEPLLCSSVSKTY